MHLDHPQSLNRYAYVMNSPCNAVDPMGLDPIFGFLALWRVISPGEGPPDALVRPGWGYGGTLGDGSTPFHGHRLDLEVGAGGGGPAAQWDKQWGDTMPCQKSAQEVMAALQKDFSQLASFNVPPAYASFTGEIKEGSTVNITIGASVPVAPGLPGIPVPVNTVAVNVSSVTPNAFTFTTTSDHFMYPGYVQFSATQVGSEVQFMVQAHGDWNGFWGDINKIIQAGEAITWGHLTNQIREICK